jgi:hypothetical protein
MPLFWIGCLGWKRTFSDSNTKDDIAHWGKKFQADSIISAIGDDILLDNRSGWIHDKYGSMINANQGVHLVGSERYVSATYESPAEIQNK